MLHRINCDGTERTVRDLTIAEARAIREKLGVSYLDLDPAWDPDHRAAVLQAFLARTMGEAKAKAKVDAMTAAESEELVVVQTKKHGRLTVSASVELAFETGETVEVEPDDGDDETLPTEWDGAVPLEGSGPPKTDSSSSAS
jgi:hypothetical protein